MGKRKKQAAQMGRGLKKNFGKSALPGNVSFLHTADLNTGGNDGKIALQSITEQSSLDDFLLTAEMANRDFTAEKSKTNIMPPQHGSGIRHLSMDSMKEIKAAQAANERFLRIPRRPTWNESTPADKLRLDEQTAFLDWRRQLGKLQEEEHIVITPYEKNLEFWRQLWRVIERSDVVVQIVDGRNPLLFWCSDMDTYVKEINPKKKCLLLINKADLLTANQRKAWADYFHKKGVNVAFWSAVQESARLDREQNADGENSQTEPPPDKDEDGTDENEDEDKCNLEETPVDENDLGCHEEESQKEHDNQAEPDENDSDCDDSDGYETIEETTDDEAECEAGSVDPCSETVPVSSELKNSSELLELFRREAITNFMPGVTTVGMVGYPNVGKSSTINAILQTKKVPVSATPGRTKHFQTLYVEKDLMLCDCPGLVFPSFVDSKAELVVNGILPIDQLQGSEPPVELVSHRVGRNGLEAAYHLNLPPAEKWEDPDQGPSAHDLLQAYGSMRGFRTHKGNPDRPRSARYILKDYVNGKLLFCHPPPGTDEAAFQKPPYGTPKMAPVARLSTQKTEYEKETEKLERDFFKQINIKAHAKGPHAVDNYVRTEALRQVGGQVTLEETSSLHSSQTSINDKPWKRHNNRNKKEKLRRVYADMDKH